MTNANDRSRAERKLDNACFDLSEQTQKLMESTAKLHASNERLRKQMGYPDDDFEAEIAKTKKIIDRLSALGIPSYKGLIDPRLGIEWCDYVPSPQKDGVVYGVFKGGTYKLYLNEIVGHCSHPSQVEKLVVELREKAISISMPKWFHTFTLDLQKAILRVKDVRWIDPPMPMNAEKDIVYGYIIDTSPVRFRFVLNGETVTVFSDSNFERAVREVRSKVLVEHDTVTFTAFGSPVSEAKFRSESIGDYILTPIEHSAIGKAAGIARFVNNPEVAVKKSAKGYPVKPKPAPRVEGADFVHDVDKKKITINWIASVEDITNTSALHACIIDDLVYLFFNGQEAVAATTISSVLQIATELVRDTAPQPKQDLVQPDWDPMGLYVDHWGGPPPPEVSGRLEPEWDPYSVLPLVDAPKTRLRDRHVAEVLNDISPAIGWGSAGLSAGFTTIGSVILHTPDAMLALPFTFTMCMVMGRLGVGRPHRRADQFLAFNMFIDMCAMIVTPSWAVLPVLTAQVVFYRQLIKMSSESKPTSALDQLKNRCSICDKYSGVKGCGTPACVVRIARERGSHDVAWCAKHKKLVLHPMGSVCGLDHPKKLRWLPGHMLVVNGKLTSSNRTTYDCPACGTKTTHYSRDTKTPMCATCAEDPPPSETYWSGAV